MSASRIFSSAIAGIILLAGACQPAGAFSLHEGDVLTFNVDFTGQNPPPPYTLYTALRLSFSDVNGSDLATYEFFGGLHHTGTLLATFPQEQLSYNLTLFGMVADMLDGIFSIRLTVDQGEFNVDSLSAVAYNSAGSIPDATAPVTLDLPEPTTLALFGTVAAFAALRRRQPV